MLISFASGSIALGTVIALLFPAISIIWGVSIRKSKPKKQKTIQPNSNYKKQFADINTEDIYGK